MMSTRFPETFTRSILSCMKIVEKEMYNKMVCRFYCQFILSIKPFFQFQVTSRFTLQLIHIHTFTVTSTKCNAKCNVFCIALMQFLDEYG